MTTPLPDSLARFGEQLERALERDRRAGRRRHRRGVAIRISVATAAAVAMAAGATSLLGGHSAVAPPGVATASAAERAAAVLSGAPGSIVHDAASYREVGPNGSVSTWREETWRQTTRPYARRELITRDDGVVIETASVGERPAQLYDAHAGTIYTNPPAGLQLGTPMPAHDGDPLREQLLGMLRSGEARAVRRSTAGGAPVIRFAYRNPLPTGGAVDWTYLVDAKTYQPMLIKSTSPDGSSTTARFETYDTLAPSEQTKALLDLRRQHPGAAIDRTEAGYQEAQQRIDSQPAGRGR